MNLVFIHGCRASQTHGGAKARRADGYNFFTTLTVDLVASSSSSARSPSATCAKRFG